MVWFGILAVCLSHQVVRCVDVIPHEHVEKFYQYGYQVEDTYTGKIVGQSCEV